MKCTKCGHENSEGSVFCSKCAAKLEASIICPKCSNENLPDALFCQKCATRIVPAEYCRFCGGEISAITGRCSQCNKDRNGETPKFSQAVGAVKQGATQVFSGIDRTWLEPGLVLLASVVMVIILLSKWVDSNLSSSLMNILGQNNVPAGITMFNAVKLYEAAIAGTKGGVFIVVPYLLIGLSVTAIIFFGIVAKEIFNGNAEAKFHGYSHFKKACVFMLSIMAIFMISIFVMQAQLNDIMETQWGYSGANLRLEMTAGIYLGLVLSIGGLVYVSKRHSLSGESGEKYDAVIAGEPGERFYKEEKNVCWSCNKSLPQGAAFCATCGVDQNAWKGPNVGSELPLKDKICPACGKANVGDSVFCAQCGSSL